MTVIKSTSVKTNVLNSKMWKNILEKITKCLSKEQDLITWEISKLKVIYTKTMLK